MFPNFQGGGQTFDGSGTHPLAVSETRSSSGLDEPPPFTAPFPPPPVQEPAAIGRFSSIPEPDFPSAAAAHTTSSSGYQGESMPAAGSRASSGSNDMAGHLSEYVSGVISFAADAKLGAQVARVRMGLDAKVRQAVESQVFSQLGLPSLTGRDRRPTEDSADLEGVPEMIHRVQFSQEHLKVLISALDDYQRHRQGLADSGQRLSLALQEVGQRDPGAWGEAMNAIGQAHQKAASSRRQAHNVEEMHVLSKLRAHDAQASADCQQSVRRYEAAVSELRLLRHAREEAQKSKQAASGDSALTPKVEKDAAQLENDYIKRVRAAGETVKAKVCMFEAKHASDYASSVAGHAKTLSDEEVVIAKAFAEIEEKIQVIRRNSFSTEAFG